MNLKEYQQQSLDCLEKFFNICKESNNPSNAYEETTRDWFGTPLHYRPLPTLPKVPYICLRIPTGGGKTLVGGMAIERVNRSLLFTRHSVTIWLVPSEPIREQTLKALRSPSNLLHQAVFSSLGDVVVLDINEALRVQPATLNGANVIIVSTMQSFKQEDKDRLNVYKQSGSLMPHFENISDPTTKGNHSLVDVLRMRHPFIVVDEAHNQGTTLAFETLARFEPSAILELTATPDRSFQPSNVLCSVSAAALQAAEMIKLPLELIRRANWQDALRDAIARLNSLQEKANAEMSVTGEYLRPIMLLQAERHTAERETLTPERVKAAMLSDFGVPDEEIAIATGTVDEIAGEDILSKQCRKRYIITIDKLREGWDCPFAYVLCAFRNTNSATAAEQVLGRILRMPYAKRKTHPELNEAYAFITSANMQATVESLRDGLVKNGFERQETRELIHSPEESLENDLFALTSSVTFSTPELPLAEMIPLNLRDKIEIIPEEGSITIKGHLSKAQEVIVEDIFKTTLGKEAARQAFVKLNEPKAQRQKTPSEMGELFHVPVLAYRNGDLWEEFEETHMLQGDWHILDYPTSLSEEEFKKPESNAEGGRFTVTGQGSIRFEYLDRVETQLACFDYQNDWSQVELVFWLERNIFDDSLIPDEKAAFLNRCITNLLDERGFTLEDLSYAKFRLRSALEEKIKHHKRDAIKKVHQKLISSLDAFSVDSRCEVIFQQGRYAYNWQYNGFRVLPKHFFPVIGDLKAEGEELECAVFLATQLIGVKYWVRNIERKSTSFSLQTCTDRFYPDFICLLDDGRVLVVEYKGADRWETSDSVEKRQIGELWARRSNGKGIFIMPKGKDWEALRSAILIR